MPLDTHMHADAATSADPDLAIDAKGLTKVYRGQGKAQDKLALDQVDLQIPRGSLFGLLGPNGAGKSTFINILAGLVTKTSGIARIWGYDVTDNPRMAKASIGVVPQELNIDPFFTPEEMLDVQAGLYGVPKAERRTKEILDMIGLADKRDAYARTLSGGMRRRLLIGKALVHNPPVLVLDEPTAGVDIELRRQLWENVVALNKRGTTVVLTTHYLDAKTVRVTVRETLAIVPEKLAQMGATIHPQDGISDGPTVMTVAYRPSAMTAGQIISAVTEANLHILDLSTEETDLEDIFLQLTKHD